jgi:hypothetical protein
MLRARIEMTEKHLRNNPCSLKAQGYIEGNTPKTEAMAFRSAPHRSGSTLPADGMPLRSLPELF